MRVACRLASEVLDYLTPHRQARRHHQPDRQAWPHDYITQVQGTISGAAGLHGRQQHALTPSRSAPRSTTWSATASRTTSRSKKGDIINLDITVIKDGWFGDNSRMFVVGDASIAAKRLCAVTYEAMWHGILQVQARAPTWATSATRSSASPKATAISVVREFCGHGIGRGFHEEPQVLHYGRPGTLEELKPGMTFTIEPMINAGKRDIKEDAKGGQYDGWTIVTRDHSLSAQWEHTVLVTETGYEVLTAVGRQPAAAGLRHADPGRR